MKSIIDFQIFDEPILQKIGLLLIKDNKLKDLSAIIDEFDSPEEKRLISEILFDDVNSDDPKLIIRDCFATIRGKLIKDQIKQGRIKIRECCITMCSRIWKSIIIFLCFGLWPNYGVG